MKAKKYIGAKPSHGVGFRAGRRELSRNCNGVTRSDSERKWTLVRGEEAPIGGTSLVELERRLKSL